MSDEFTVSATIIEFYIKDLQLEACIHEIKRLLRQIKEVEYVGIWLSSSRIRIVLDSDNLLDERRFEIEVLLQKAGYLIALTDPY